MPATFDDTTIEQLRKLHKFLVDFDYYQIDETLNGSLRYLDRNQNQFMYAVSQAIGVLEAIK